MEPDGYDAHPRDALRSRIRRPAKSPLLALPSSLDLAPDCCLVTDTRGNIWECNRAAAAMLGISQEHLYRRSLLAFLAGEDQRAFREQLHRLVNGDPVRGFEASIRPKDRSPIVVLLEVDAIHDAGGKAVGLRWTLHDVSLQRRVEAGLARSNALLTALGHLVTRVQTTTDVDQVMETLGAELKQLALDCFIALLEPDNQTLVVRYFSTEPPLLGLIEKLISARIVGFRLPRERFRLYAQVMEQRQPVYVADWVSVITPLLPGVPGRVVEKAGQLAQVTPSHRFIYLPLQVHDRAIGIMGIWGENLVEEDIAPLSIFAGQVAIALEHGRLFREYELQRGQLRALSSRLVTIMEDERRRIARELHDEAGQLLYGLHLHLDVLASNIPDDHPDLKEQAANIGGLAEEARQHIRQLSHDLRPATLDELGLVPALRQLVHHFRRGAGPAITLKVAGREDRLAPQVETACFRIVQEALTNAVRHAEAGRVHVRLTYADDCIHVDVRDNGHGFDPGGDPPDGVGLIGIQERAASLGGEVEIDSTPGRGTRLAVRLPAMPAEE